MTLPVCRGLKIKKKSEEFFCQPPPLHTGYVSCPLSLSVFEKITVRGECHDIRTCCIFGRKSCHPIDAMATFYFSLRAKSFHPSIVAGIHQASARFQKLLPDVKTFTNDKVSCHPMAIYIKSSRNF